MPIALITGASRGLGEALAQRLSADGWSLVVDARGADALQAVVDRMTGPVVALAGDVSDAGHRHQLIKAAQSLGGLDALVNNASLLGPSPLRAVADVPADDLRSVFDVNVVAPLALAGLALPLLRETGGRIINISSDAGVEAYEGWGGYGASKAALEHAVRVLALEEPAVRVYVVDPGDMRTQMNQDAYPGEDISDRPLPEASVPGLVALLNGDLPSGRYLAREVEAGTA